MIDGDVRMVWIVLLMKADSSGYAAMDISTLAQFAMLNIGHTTRAIEQLRRLNRIEAFSRREADRHGGWRILDFERWTPCL